MKYSLFLLLFLSCLQAQYWHSFQEAQYLEKVQGDLKRALIIYQQLLEQKEDLSFHYLVRYRIAFISEIYGKVEEAQTEYEKIRESSVEPASHLATERLRLLRTTQIHLQQESIESLTATIEDLHKELFSLKNKPETDFEETTSPEKNPLENKNPTQIDSSNPSKTTENKTESASKAQQEELMEEKLIQSQQKQIEELLQSVGGLQNQIKTLKTQKQNAKNITSNEKELKTKLKSLEVLFEEKESLFLQHLQKLDYSQAHHLLEEMEQELNLQKTPPLFLKKAKLKLQSLRKKLNFELDKIAQNVANLAQSKIVRNHYKQYSYLTRLVVGKPYQEKQFGENGFPDLRYKILGIPKTAGPEKLIQLIKQAIPIIPFKFWNNSQAYIQFKSGFLEISQHPRLNDTIRSFLNSIGNPRPISLKVSFVSYSSGELDPFLVDLLRSRINPLNSYDENNSGYFAPLTSNETLDFERFISRSGLARFNSKLLPLKHLRESSCSLNEEYKIITGYLQNSVQDLTQEINDDIQYGLNLKMTPICLRDGNLTLVFSLKNQILRFPVDWYMTESGMIHLPHLQTQQIQYPIWLRKGQSVILFGFKNPFANATNQKEHLLLHLQAMSRSSEIRRSQNIQAYDLADSLLEGPPDYSAPKMRHISDPGLSSRSSVLQEFIQRYGKEEKNNTLTAVVNGTRLEVEGNKKDYKNVENLLAKIRTDMDKLVNFQVRVFTGNKTTFPLSYLKKVDSSFFSRIRSNGPETLILLGNWGKTMPLSKNFVWAANTQKVYLHSYQDSSFIPNFMEKKFMVYPKIEKIQNGMTFEVRPILAPGKRIYFQTKISGALFQRFKEGEQKISSLEPLRVSMPEKIEHFEGEGTFELREREALVLIKPLSRSRQLVVWISPSIHQKTK